MLFISMIAVVALLILMIRCATRESRIVGFYKALHICGRFRAYLITDFLMIGIIYPIVMLISASPALNGILNMGNKEMFLNSLLSLACLAAGSLLLWSTYQKCPADLKDSCIRDIFTIGLGVGVKIGVFFLFFLWKVMGPQEMRDENGNTVYLYNGNVYAPNGEKVGVSNGDGTYTKISGY